ncbi:MAG: hypothetical protein RIF33_01390 [Cyclobacteriaceae bacterium]
MESTLGGYSRGAIANLFIRSKGKAELRKVADAKGQVIIVVVFLISRLIMVLSGIRIHVDYAFMHFHDVELIQNRFWESVFYTHAFTPWINMVVGFVFLFPESSHMAIYQTLFYLMSISSLLIFYRLLIYFKIKDWVSVSTVIFFSLIPAYIYFEHFLSYTFPSMLLVLIVTYALLKTLEYDTFRSWLIFFSWCVLLCFVRTTFHYIWLIAIITGVLILQKQLSKKVLLAFALPATLLFGWCLKNFILFGFFGASSWAGFNLSFTTVNRLNLPEKEQLVKAEKLSPLALIPIYSGIESYQDYVDLEEKTGIAVLDETQKGQPGWNNYNHKGFIELSPLRMKDNLFYMKEFPLQYFRTVAVGVAQFFGPTSRWHPHDAAKSPHIPIREKIEGWEDLYNIALHTLPIRKVGLYMFFLAGFAFILFRYLRDLFKWKTFNRREKVFALSAMNVFYVTSLSCLVTIGELARYRFMIEPLIWLLFIVFITESYRKIKTSISARDQT